MHAYTHPENVSEQEMVNHLEQSSNLVMIWHKENSKLRGCYCSLATDTNFLTPSLWRVVGSTSDFFAWFALMLIIAVKK